MYDLALIELTEKIFPVGGRNNSLWIEITTWFNLLKVYFLLEEDIVHCGHRPQYYWIHEEYISCQWMTQFIVYRGHNIIEIMEDIFPVRGRHSSLWTESTTLLNSRRIYFLSEEDTVHCGQRPQHYWINGEYISCWRKTQFIVDRGHNITELTENIFPVGGRHSSLWTEATTLQN